MYRQPSYPEIFARKTMPIPECGCLIWIGAVKHWYGVFSKPGKKQVPAHRVAYEMANGPIPVGLVIDHKCRVKSCVNPDHLRVVTNAVNVTENSASVAALNKAKTHCKRGHPLTPDNLVKWSNPNKSSGKRTCLACHSLRQLRYSDKLSSVGPRRKYQRKNPTKHNLRDASGVLFDGPVEQGSQRDV